MVRKYHSVQQSVADHTAYLLGAMRNDTLKRYPGIAECKDPMLAVQLLQDGCYSTSSTYAADLFSVIERYNLTKYDL